MSLRKHKWAGPWKLGSLEGVPKLGEAKHVLADSLGGFSSEVFDQFQATDAEYVAV
ncbi:hypothetical protein ACRALDRAFT_2037000 [Sodiomyces alcalophilus JCM 7366]|uniref:uncharacterized protein n=1 Tax=Sodiomyces alcalophilus JCM 7366 TaxID=591952 RepID=UPI0039B648BC